MQLPEAWLRGALPGIAAPLQPAAHALVQAAEDIAGAATGLTIEELWTRPGGAASAGFHLRHIAGSIERLLTYGRGEQLNARQREALRLEREPGDPPADAESLILQATGAIEVALGTLQTTNADAMAEPRAVGRAELPSTVGGILFHIAEHTQRHTGQLITTARIVRALGPTPL
ncbi:MAG TPA: DinB family protein [Gemmatimonadaceae bacterium]|nr:DinB family protein [Gemmatimonadaceae bacterium]